MSLYEQLREALSNPEQESQVPELLAKVEALESSAQKTSELNSNLQKTNRELMLMASKPAQETTKDPEPAPEPEPDLTPEEILKQLLSERGVIND